MDFVDKNDNDGEDETTEAERKLLGRLEKHFLMEGLSKFSSRAAVAYFQVRSWYSIYWFVLIGSCHLFFGPL